MSYLPRGNDRRRRRDGSGPPTPPSDDEASPPPGEAADGPRPDRRDQDEDPTEVVTGVGAGAPGPATPTRTPAGAAPRGGGAHGEHGGATAVSSRRQRRRRAREAERRPFLLTGLSTLVPGSGLTLARRRALGVPLLILFGIGVLLGLVYLIRRGFVASALDLAARPGLLRGVAILAIAAAVVWIGQIVLTAIVSRPRPTSRPLGWTLTAFTMLMCLLVAMPTAIGIRYIGAHTDAADKIFVEKTVSAGGSSTITRDPEAADPWEGIPRVNVLLLGSDAADSREGVRTDSMIVASIDTETGDTVLFSIPRNLEYVPIPESNPLSQAWPNGYDCGDACLMNGIWTEAEAAAENDPAAWEGVDNPGLTATQDVIAEILGLPIDHTIILDLAGFQGLVDAMGGVDINVQERVPIGGETYTDANGGTALIPGTENGWIEVGEQHLNGRQTLWYARSRATSDDFSRIRRQRCVVGALINQVEPVSMLRNYADIAEVAGDNVSVDIPQDELPAWVDLVLRVQGASIRTLPFTPENIQVADPDYDGIREDVQAALAPPPEPTATPTPSTDEGGDAAQETEPEPEPETTEPTTEEPTPDDESTTPGGVPTDDELAEIGTVC